MELARIVEAGLLSSPKTLPPAMFYDEKGSALFEAITRTPEYYLTRTERGIFEAHGAEILRRANGRGPLAVVELGAGSAEKTRVLLRTLVASQGATEYVPIDLSPTPILAASEALERELPGLRARPVVGDNASVLRDLPREGPSRLILFIGSSIGNYEPEDAAAFLSTLAAAMRPGDRVLLGTDMVKDKALLDAAYNDADGLTARFNLNALVRLRREFGAELDLAAFEHRAFYDPVKRRVEMHLVSRRDQRVRVETLALSVDLARGETIHTENSYKYTQTDVAALAKAAGLEIDRSWSDAQAWFGVHLLRRAAP